MADFKDLQIALMDSYNSQGTNHVGYVIAVSIAFAGALFNKDLLQFLLQGWNPLLLIFVVSLFLGVIAYFLARISYWSYLGTMVLAATETDAASTKQLTDLKGIERWIIIKYHENHNYFENHNTFASFLLSTVIFLASAIAFIILNHYGYLAWLNSAV